MSIAITEKQFKEFQGYKKGYYRLKEENNNLHEKANQLLKEADIKKLKEEIKEYEHESCESLVKEQKLYGQIFQLQKEKEELEEKITCLESDSHNEVSQAEFDDMQEDLEAEIKKLKRCIKEYESN
jgi:uncharacterized phage infection (PIP) family protein YhgE